MLTLEQIILQRGDVEKIYRGDLTLTLWRALRTDASEVTNPLYPDLKERVLPNGKIREADVATYTDPKSGNPRVRAEEGRGTSVTDQPGIFGHRDWEYVVIPKGTSIPSELIITKDHYMLRKKSGTTRSRRTRTWTSRRFSKRSTSSPKMQAFNDGWRGVPEIDIRSLSVCIQALQDAIKFADFLSQSQTVNPSDHEESSYMYELELSRLIKIYANEERAGRVNIPLARLLRPPFDALLSSDGKPTDE